MTYFTVTDTTTAADLKSQYRAAAHKAHPDKGGRKEDFVKMQNEYEKALVKVSTPVKKKRQRFVKYSDAELAWMLRELDKIAASYSKAKKKKQKKK